MNKENLAIAESMVNFIQKSDWFIPVSCGSVVGMSSGLALNAVSPISEKQTFSAMAVGAISGVFMPKVYFDVWDYVYKNDFILPLSSGLMGVALVSFGVSVLRLFYPVSGKQAFGAVAVGAIAGASMAEVCEVCMDYLYEKDFIFPLAGGLFGGGIGALGVEFLNIAYPVSIKYSFGAIAAGSAMGLVATVGVDKVESVAIDIYSDFKEFGKNNAAELVTFMASVSTNLFFTKAAHYYINNYPYTEEMYQNDVIDILSETKVSLPLDVVKYGILEFYSSYEENAIMRYESICGASVMLSILATKAFDYYYTNSSEVGFNF